MKLKDLRDKLVKETAKKEVKEKVVKITNDIDEKRDTIIAYVGMAFIAYGLYKAGYANGARKALNTMQNAKVYNLIVNR